MKKDNETPEKPQAAPLSEKKRTAMLRYIAVLFAVAFALVLLSYLIQARNSQTTIKELNATSASALQNAEQLQETNRELTEENKRLNDAVDNANAVAQEYHESAEISRQNAHAEGVAEGREEGKEETRKAYDLLMEAIASKYDHAKLEKLLSELEPMKDLLSEEALAQYEALK